MNNKYIKGVVFERDIVEKFSADGFVAMRVAGSGRYSELLPDVLIMKNSLVMAIQCKKTKSDKIYLSKGVENFKKFKEIANIKCIFAVKFLKKDVRFYDLEKIDKNIDINDPFEIYEDLARYFRKI
ncbi:putative Resolvase, Holliday junction-type [groundwater metagenome]|uniref:Putative Resolvase, Holliday junction-type n=1 Tax=groundwater metagenome TaxID=717931 RepID=A0A098E7B8_9ZZZZ